MKTAQNVMEDYSALTDSEKRKFEKSFRSLMTFRRWCKLVFSGKVAIIKDKKTHFEFKGKKYAKNQNDNTRLGEDVDKAGYTKFMFI